MRALEVADSQMSGIHARIVCGGAAVVLEDAGSTNGALVNGTQIARRELRDGDVIELGQTIFVYRELEEVAGSRVPSLDSSDIVGSAPGFATLDPKLACRLERLARVAPSPLSILLLGETGSGKEVLARGLHALSGRPGPFVAVNCGAIPHSLVESQLFGHVRGAFSGALKDEPGLVRAAQHGTLLLDEIGDLPASSQAALLRVLQESEVQPVGSARTEKVDVRVIAATNMSLEALIERDAFRRDLYARIAAYTFVLAPLRERRVDLGLLIAALLADGKRDPQRAVRIQNDASRALVRHSWPMNVRELEHCLRAACVLAEDAVIGVDDLPPAVLGVRGPIGAPERAGATPASDALLSATPAIEALAAETLALDSDADLGARIAALLAEHDGNISAVSRALRTSRSQIYRLIARSSATGKPS